MKKYDSAIAEIRAIREADEQAAAMTEDALLFEQPPYRVLPVPVPVEFAQDEALLRLCGLLVPILSSKVISEHELTKRIIRHHPAQEGV